MRVVLVSPYSLAVFGGVQTQVLGLARALADSADVTVLAPDASSSSEEVAVVDVGTTTSLPANGSRAPVAVTPGAWRRTLAALGRLDPDVVHVHEPFVPAVGIASLRSGRPVVATFHRAGAGAGYRAAAPLLGPLATRIGAASAVSEAAAATLRAVLGHRCGTLRILPNGIEPSRYSGSRERAGGPPTLLFVGRLERRKGLAVLLDAMRFLDAAVSLEVIGTGPEERALRGRCAGDRRVRFLGAVDDAEKALRLRSADLFVAPSLAGESFGVILLEAMAAGTPVVASDLDGYRLAAGVAAELTPPGDAESLASAIARLLSDAPRRQELVRLGHERAETYSFRGLAEHYQVLYEEAVGGARWNSRR